MSTDQIAEGIECFQLMIRQLMKIDPELRLNWVMCLYEIAMHEGITPGELAKRMSMPNTSLSAIIGVLGDKGRGKTPYGLITTRTMKHDRRSHQLYLTDKGRTLIEKLAMIPSLYS